MYYDDVIGILRCIYSRTAENATKNLIKLFEKYEFKIRVESGLIQRNFLNVSFNILNSSYRPYNKRNSLITYVKTTTPITQNKY